jgi:hypothetical protein
MPESLTKPNQITHEINALKEIMFTRFDAMDKAVTLFQENLTRVPTDVDKQVSQLKGIIETRLTGMDEATRLLREDMARVPSESDKAVQHLRELCEEKFDSITTQFRERDTRTEQTSKDSKVAVDAALQAAKEAVGEQNKSSALAIAKSEAATNKQIDQIGALITATNSGTSDKIDDIKERLIAIEGRSKGTGDVWGLVIGIAGMLIAVAAIVFSFLHKN